MAQKIAIISEFRLMLLLIPVAIACFLYFYFTKEIKQVLLAFLRMVVQLVSLGFVLLSLFQWENPYVCFLLTIFVLVVSAFIITRNTKNRKKTIAVVFLAQALGAIPLLFFVIYFVLQVPSFSPPTYYITLLGMTISNSMNALTLSLERYDSEIYLGKTYKEARSKSFTVSMIPSINGLLAVGLVSIPGMMTGQILAGVSPFIAVRYQIVIMCMTFCASSFSVASLLYLLSKKNAIN